VQSFFGSALRDETCKVSAQEIETLFGHSGGFAFVGNGIKLFHGSHLYVYIYICHVEEICARNSTFFIIDHSLLGVAWSCHQFMTTRLNQFHNT
jgi:hypothetical protein